MKYSAIFFDWDGTAVKSRKAPVEEAVKCMKPLLNAGVYLIIISGTTYENIGGGRLHEFFTPEELKKLYLGLGRGAYNYGFKEGKPVILNERKPDVEQLIKIHRASYQLHEVLLREYGLNTDIVFSRPNYCKVDLMAAHDRGEHLFLQQSEIEKVNRMLKENGMNKGLSDVLALAEALGKNEGVQLCATTDAKYVEIGLSTKSDNVNYFMENIIKESGIDINDCCFWGDEFCYLAEGISGSDAYMITEKTKQGHFFDVSEMNAGLPQEVKYIGGGVKSFLDFLEQVNVG